MASQDVLIANVSPLAQNLYINLDENLQNNNPIPTIVGNFCNFAHMPVCMLWHPGDTINKLKYICLKDKPYSGDIILIGHGNVGFNAIWSKNEYFKLSGDLVIELLCKFIPNEYIKSTRNIFFTQCKSSLTLEENSPGYPLYFDHHTYLSFFSATHLYGSVIHSAAGKISSNKEQWPLIEAIHANRYNTIFKPGELYINAPKGNLSSGNKINNLLELVDPKKYGTTIYF